MDPLHVYLFTFVAVSWAGVTNVSQPLIKVHILLQGRLPLRWMAYESIFNGITTNQSDALVIVFSLLSFIACLIEQLNCGVIPVLTKDQSALNYSHI